MANCRKCGSDSVGTEYRSWQDDLRKICRTCGFAWHELPLDRQAAAQAKALADSATERQ